MDISEEEALKLARTHVGFPVHPEPTEFDWGWVFSADAPSMIGPGPVSVTRRGKVISHGSLPVTFSNGAPPVLPASRKNWLAWLFLVAGPVVVAVLFAIVIAMVLVRLYRAY